MDESNINIEGLRTRLIESEDRFSKVFDASPSLIAITTMETGQIYAVNQAWLDMTGYARDEAIGKTSLELQLWANPDQREDFIETFKKRNTLRNYELGMRAKSGEVRTYLAFGDKIEFDGGTRLLMVFHDITERKQAEEILRRSHEELEGQVAERTIELQRQIEATEQAKVELEDSELRLMESNRMLSQVLDTIPVRVFWKDLNLNFMGCNRLFAMDAGYQNPRQVLGKSDFEMGWRAQAKLYRADDLAVIQSRRPKMGYEEPQTTPDGTEIWLRTSKSPLRNLDGSVIGVLGMYEDITERKRDERELESAKLEAERANQAKSQFLSSMSHELRTPLNAILGFAQLMEYNPAQPLTASQSESISHIKTGGKHLLNLINEILELAKVEAGHLEFNVESVSLDEICNDVAPMAQALAKNHGISFSAPVLDCAWPNIAVDAMRLKQVLLNLLSNAVKYNVQNGEVSMRCEQADTCMRISISDTGLGIAEKSLADLFKPFSRLVHDSGEIEGTGIGLTITRELVERMGGAIGVKSDLGRGSTFWVEFPITQ